MKKLCFALFTGMLLTLSLSIKAETKAITLNFISDSKNLDLVALRATRKVIGTAIGEGIVDSFIISPYKTNVLNPKSTGYSACIEAGIGATPQSFDSFVKKLKFIHPKRGTAVTIENSSSCQPSTSATPTPTPIAAGSAPTQNPIAAICGGLTGMVCPDHLICIDDPSDKCDPATGGQDCPGICNGSK